MPTSWPTSRKNTFSTAAIMPNPTASAVSITSRGTHHSRGQPGNRSVPSRRSRNSAKTTAKFAKLDNATIAGSVIRGKLVFFIMFAFSMKTVDIRPTISANRFQVNIPAHKYTP